MFPLLRLFWLRETGCDAGTVLRAGELESKFQLPDLERTVIRLIEPAANPAGAGEEAGEDAGEEAGEEAGEDAGEDAGEEIELRLPYLDRREWRKRSQILAACAWERRGNALVPVLSSGMLLRHTAAELVMAHPVWTQQAALSEDRHFAAWRAVSAGIQRSLREWIPRAYFRDLSRFADREAAYPMIVYQAARIFHTRPHGGFTYDLRDYPECRLTVALATKMTGRSVQTVLAGIEERLRAEGMPELARRYAPVWHQDVVRAVRRKPKGFIGLLSAESTFLNALAELGLNRTLEGVHHFSKAANPALRSVYGMDLRNLGVRALEETTRILAEYTGAVTSDPNAAGFEARLPPVPRWDSEAP